MCSVSVRDDGPGFPMDSRDRLFEPHYTTKGDGSGVGLFMSYGIVREHQGQIFYEGSDAGATFVVVLPRYSVDSTAQAADLNRLR